MNAFEFADLQDEAYQNCQRQIVDSWTKVYGISAEKAEEEASRMLAPIHGVAMYDPLQPSDRRMHLHAGPMIPRGHALVVVSDDVYDPPPGGYIDTPFGNSVFVVPIPVEDYAPDRMKDLGVSDPKEFAWNMFDALSRLMTDKGFRDYMSDGDESKEPDIYKRFAVCLLAGACTWKPEVSQMVDEIAEAQFIPLVLICRGKEKGMRIVVLSIGAAAPDDMFEVQP